MKRRIQLDASSHTIGTIGTIGQVDVIEEA
jgi:hypothetical protein